MDFFKRELAPLSEEAWEEIDNRATQVLKARLTGRRAVHVKGPFGWEGRAVPAGRLKVLETPKGGVQTGLHQVHPLVEARRNFELDRWEMDNISRGAGDPDLEPLEDCIQALALFEEKAIFQGYGKGGIKGLMEAAETEALPLGNEHTGIMDALSMAVLRLRGAFQEGPFTLIVGKEGWQRIHQHCCGFPLRQQVEDLIGGGILFSAALEKQALLIPYDHEDLELTLGVDFSIGYHHHDSEKVRLFATESFFFRVLDPSLIVPFKV